nr:uncharacterized protein I206_00215 [Kwoniella pini CBS 10737]OCF52914.1 hypothetical protein I206_00215 [Kwoniella pini CBS 10737]
MNDLVDLDWSVPGTKPAQQVTKPLTGGANNSFDLLSLSKPTTTGGNTPNYYSSTPLRSSTPSQVNPILPSQVQPSASRFNGSTSISRSNTPVQNASPASQQGTSGNGGLDAFSSLLSIPSSSSGIKKDMTMADRQKALEDEKRRQADEDKKRFDAEGHFWENLGSSFTSKLVASSSSSIKPTVKQNDDLDEFLTPTAAAPSRSKTPISASIPKSVSSSRPPSAAGTFWDHHNFTNGLVPSSISAPLKSKSASPAPPIDPFDFDSLSNSIQHQPESQNGNSTGPTMDEDEFDILGDLGKPVIARPELSIEPTQSGPSRPPRQSSTDLSSSPPPHIVGQIVEMGFSPAQARQALAKTSTGLDVQAAMEVLLGGSNAQAERQRGEEEFDEDDGDFVERERQRREEEDRERRRRRRQGPSRDSVTPRSAEEREREAEATAQDQAEKYLAQASEIGTNMFNKATSFWNSSKEKALKVYEEQRKAMEANAAAGGSGEGRKPVKDGRPKWMTEGNSDISDEITGDKSGFRDDDEIDALRIRQDRQRNGAGSSIKITAKSSTRANPPPNDASSSSYRSSKERADLLFADEAPKYISPARHPKKPTTPSMPISRSPVPVKPLPSRQLVSATPHQIEKSSSFKVKGNDHFKLGRFAEAESSYTTAITQLPAGHLFLIPLYNNRAAARLKLGDSAPAVEDCTLVIDLIGPTYHPSKEAALPVEVTKDVKLYDGLVKAFSKRAQAWEMGEKWKKALEDWEKLLGMDLIPLGSGASSTKNLAAEGARRARKMLEGDSGVKSIANKPVVNSVVKPKPQASAKTADVNRSAAVSELRAQAKALEVEDEQRLALKDVIESRLNNWKNGKETNLRALIASLDSILWDDILKGGLKVGIHELISEKQVKIKYMKVIARLHPDKLNSQNTTVEQRMLANGAFGTLNEV